MASQQSRKRRKRQTAARTNRTVRENHPGHVPDKQALEQTAAPQGVQRETGRDAAETTSELQGIEQQPSVFNVSDTQGIKRATEQPDAGALPPQPRSIRANARRRHTPRAFRIAIAAGIVLLLAAAVAGVSIGAWSLIAYLTRPSDVVITAGDRSLVVSITAPDETWSVGEPVTGEPEQRALRTRREIVWPILHGGASAGAVTLTLDDTADGAVFYLRSDAPTNLVALLETPEPDGLTARTVVHGDGACAAAANPAWGPGYSPDGAVYLEGGTLHLYVSRLTLLTGLGQTVYITDTPKQGVTLAHAEQEMSVQIPLQATEQADAVVNGALTPQTLVNWDNEQAQTDVLWLDTSENNYHVLADGQYVALPDTYRPHLADSEEPHIYRSVSSWLLGPCTNEDSGPLFTALGKSFFYSYLDSINSAGFMPTVPSSTWLREDYGLDAGFYDTRFNFDTMDKLMRADKLWNEPEIAPAMDRMLSFYLDYGSRQAFQAYGLWFVPDYGDGSTEKKPNACSLNHYLAEGLLLLRAGETYGSQEYETRGQGILHTIDVSANHWIRRTGDLWYAIRPDGEFEKNDYVSVTYLDLVDAAFLLEKRGEWASYEGIQRLLASKEDWLRRAGHEDLIVEHPDLTIDWSSPFS